MGLIELRADCKLQRERILSSKLPAGLKEELADNVWPFLEALVEENLGMDDAIGELIDQSDNVLQPELAAAIVGALEMGKMICKEVEALIDEADDDLRKKRVTGMLKQYRLAAEVVTDEVAAATIEMEPEDDEPADSPEPEDVADAEPEPGDVEPDPQEPQDGDAEPQEAESPEPEDDAEPDPIDDEDADDDDDTAAEA